MQARGEHVRKVRGELFIVDNADDRWKLGRYLHGWCDIARGLDIAHYQRIVVAFRETIRLMEQIDELIEAHGGWPPRWRFRLKRTSKMLTETDRRIVCEFQRRLADTVPVLDLRVFGSRVRGDAEPDSDLDVFVVLETCTPELRRRISEIAWEVGFEMDCVISTVVATRDELEHGAMGASPLILNIEREGVQP